MVPPLVHPSASNDEAFSASRGRTVPIPETLTQVPGYPDKLRIYKIAASRFWQVRCFFAGKTYSRSLRTTSMKTALDLARAFFDSTAARVYLRTGGPPPESTVRLAQVAEQMYAQELAKAARGELSKGSVQVIRNRLDRFILPELGQVPLPELHYARLRAFIDHLGKLQLSTTTISQYLVIVRKALKLAQHLGLVRDLPEFPPVRVTARPRGGFTVAEYTQLLRKARALVGQWHPMAAQLGPDERFWVARDLLCMPPDLPYVIAFMVNTFVRPGDIKKMQHKHIEEVRGRHVYLRMSLPETKRHDKPVVSMRAAVRIYRTLQAASQQRGYGLPEDPLFLPQLANREHALAVLNFHFQWVLRECGLTHGPLGQKRTLYSLRHTAITFRLLYGQGIDMLTLARNARTSVNMIERFYASSLSGEMNVGLLQSRRRGA
jgi:integrase